MTGLVGECYSCWSLGLYFTSHSFYWEVSSVCVSCCPHSEVLSIICPLRPPEKLVWSRGKWNQKTFLCILHYDTTYTHTHAHKEIWISETHEIVKLIFLITIIKNRWIRFIWTLWSAMPAWVFWHDCCDRVLQPVIYSWEVRCIHPASKGFQGRVLLTLLSGKIGEFPILSKHILN